MAIEDQLLAVGPLDGRYADRVQELVGITSEYGLIKRRVAVETGWLSLLGSGVLPDVPLLSHAGNDYLLELNNDFSVGDAAEIKAIEKTTNHDVKAVENWIRGKLYGQGQFPYHTELVHFGITSEDVNNLAYGMQIRDVRDEVLIPGIRAVATDLEAKADKYAEIPMLSRTHGQPASPTSLGKEMRVFSERLRRSQERIGAVSILGKFSGATGNYNAMTIAYPEVDWPAVSEEFVRSMGFEYNSVTTQIEPHDWTAVFCNEAALSNRIMTDVARDMWQYISLGYFTQEHNPEETGSSTMPHKVNPIDFENAEANFGSANATLDFLSAKLPISRLQRDLSDSSAQRTFGEAFGHTLVGHKSLLKGLGKVHANIANIEADINGEWSVLTEAVQTVMRRYMVGGAYDIIKAVTRGKPLSEKGYYDLVGSLEIPPEAKLTLMKLTPAKYIGLAAEIARS